MSKQEIRPAELDDTTLQKLKNLEEEMSDTAGNKIVLVAYQADAITEAVH